MNRRTFIKTLSVMGGGSLTALGSGGIFAENTTAPSNKTSAHRMPDEAEPHACTWMAFGASEAIWGRKLLPEVQRNLALIANTIAQFEPVKMLVRSADLSLARSLVHANVELMVAPLDDLWMRDSGPVFVTHPTGKVSAIQFNFNGWGNKQKHTNDQRVAAKVANFAQTPLINTHLVLEGGGIEVDGHGTAIITESCVLNTNRNPNLSKAECEKALMTLLGLRKIIWLPGIKDRDITDGHTDFYARFAKPGVVIAAFDPDPESFDHEVTKAHLAILKTATDADGRPLEVHMLQAPSYVRPKFKNNDFAAGYVNFYVCNGAVIAPEFGDAVTDGAAKKTLQTLFPDREVVQINIDGIAAGGGGIHCTTQQQPL